LQGSLELRGHNSSGYIQRRVPHWRLLPRGFRNRRSRLEFGQLNTYTRAHRREYVKRVAASTDYPENREKPRGTIYCDTPFRLLFSPCQQIQGFLGIMGWMFAIQIRGCGLVREPNNHGSAGHSKCRAQEQSP
jgi:hypothetical protein